MGDDAIRIFDKGWNYSQDGPGNRLIYHLQGCNFMCPWCSNPEGIDPDRSCREWALDQIVDEVVSARPLFWDGGGVTVTGGEPTMQFAPLKKLMERIKLAGVNLAIETNGTHPRLEELFEFMDLLIIDLKHHDDRVHRRVIGAGNTITIENLEKATRTDIPVWVRIPLIPGFNDGARNVAGMVDMVARFNGPNLAVELLPYHEYGKPKWERAGMAYSMPSTKISPDELGEYLRMFARKGIVTIKT